VYHLIVVQDVSKDWALERVKERERERERLSLCKKIIMYVRTIAFFVNAILPVEKLLV